ncbi:SRPBCC family protein [Trujillonella humicola]|uniref:SRPBCC family protein n=1 Tax=Trujillonella humicola TaxID=3383699 RepID=UPI003906646A
MDIRTIEQTIDIDAAKERVWAVLLEDATYREWAAEFMAGSYAETDWREGSPVRFLGPDGTGLLGRVVTARRPEVVDVEYEGVVGDGRDDRDSHAARRYAGTRETYRLTGAGGRTHLAISAPMEGQYYEDMVVAWDRALAKVKELAEAR